MLTIAILLQVRYFVTVINYIPIFYVIYFFNFIYYHIAHLQCTQCTGVVIRRPIIIMMTIALCHHLYTTEIFDLLCTYSTTSNVFT